MILDHIDETLKIIELSFIPKYSIENAIEDLIDFYKKLKFSNRNLSVKWLKKIKLNNINEI